MKIKINRNIVKIIFIITVSFFYAQIAEANCRIGNAEVPLKHVFYSAELDGCWTCMQYCCLNGKWSSEECGRSGELSQFSIEELCGDDMCGKDSLYFAQEKACRSCDNGIPEHGYAWGTRVWDEENGAFLCDFLCEDGYEKIPRGIQSNGLMDWDGYCKPKSGISCPSGYVESNGKCVLEEKTLRDDWTGFSYIYVGGACGNDSHAVEICKNEALPSKGLKACSGTPSCKGTDGINYNCYANVTADSWEDYCEGSWQWCAQYNADNACRLDCEYVYYTCE